METICPYCEQITNAEPFKKTETIQVRGEDFEVVVDSLRCPLCGESFDNPKVDQDPLDMAYRKYRARHGLMQPEEIRNLRNRYGLSQEVFAKILGLGVATLKRYERGSLQNDSLNTTLELIKEPHAFLRLIEQKKDFLSEKEKKRLSGILKEEIESEDSQVNYLSRYYGDYKPSIESGFKSLDVYKFFQMIIFMCRQSVSKTKLNKLLFFADFKHFKEHSVSITGMKYAHLPFGPCPDNFEKFFACSAGNGALLDTIENCIGETCWEEFLAPKQPDLSVFSDAEIKTMAEVREFFSAFSAAKIRDFSHEEQAYKETVNGEKISYDFAESLQI